MGFVKLELRTPKSPGSGNRISVDPDPYWTVDTLISELNSLELKPPGFSSPTLSHPYPLSIKKRSPDSSGEEGSDASANKPFVMCISDDEEDEGTEREEGYDGSLMTGTRFSCAEFDLSDSEGSGDEMDLNSTQTYLMDKASLAECLLFELEREHQLRVKEEVRQKVSALEAELKHENKRSTSAILRLEKYMEARREMDRRLDKQYQRKIAEALDNHLSIVQRDHEQRSQIEERRIRDDAALEEAKRKEKALHEQKMRQARVDAEARVEAARLAEESQRAALEASRKASKEGEKDDSKLRKFVTAEVAQEDIMVQNRVACLEGSKETKQEVPTSKTAGLDSTKSTKSTGIEVKAAESAIRAAAKRIEKYDEVLNHCGKLALSSNKEFDYFQRQIDKRVRQITGTVENVITKSKELIGIMNDPRCPHSISTMLFAKKVLALCENPSAKFDTMASACSHVILRVSSQVPDVIDFVLAEFHKACIYTVPKHVQCSEAAGNRTNEFWKSIGYREENGKLESSDSYLERVESYMKLYAALIQTESANIPNPHGLKEGWAWLSRFLNALPVNKFTAVALEAFLKMAGFALFRKYKSQFEKILKVISRRFLPALKARGDTNLGPIITRLEMYLEKKMHLREPEWRRLPNSVSSREFMA